MNLDNIKIADMRIILNKDTTLARYYPLIPWKETIIERLMGNGILFKSQYDEIYDSDFERIRQITEMQEGIDESFHAALHLHDFKNRSIKEFKSIGSDVIAEVLAHGYRKSLDIIKLAFEKSEEEMSEILYIGRTDVRKICALCHLMRLPGVKDTRASLYYDCGLQRLDDFRNSTQDKILETIADYIGHSGCGKSVPQKKELATQIAVSRILP